MRAEPGARLSARWSASAMRCTWASAPMRWASCPSTAWTTAGCSWRWRSCVGALVALVGRRDLPAHQRHGLHHDHAGLRADAVLPGGEPEANTAATTACSSRAAACFGRCDLNNPTLLYYLAYALLLAVLLAFWRLVHARFGMVLRGCRSNERRMASMGFPTFRYKLSAYVISALVCVLAGMLMANLTRFVAPSYMAWTVSGELIVMMVLGGLGTLIGPIAGAAALLLVEEALSSLKLGVPWLDNADQPALAGADRHLHRAGGAGAQAGHLRLAGGEERHERTLEVTRPGQALRRPAGHRPCGPGPERAASCMR